MTDSHPKAEGPRDEAHASRRLLAVLPMAPAPHICVSTLTLDLDNGLTLTVDYIADRYLLTRDGFAAYARARTAAMPWDTPLESLAALVADDIANEVVPRWLRVGLTQDSPGALRHSVAVEDRQPGWEHPTVPGTRGTAR